MKTFSRQLVRVLFFLLGFALNTPATTRYVDLNNVTPIFPYTNWLTAATNINDAVDAADLGDLILVTDGVYQTGKSISYEFGTSNPSTNRVAVTKQITVQSINGPSVTIIEGLGTVRCAYLTNGAILNGFTLTNGTIFRLGGGVYCESTNAVVTNCVLAGNRCGIPINGGGGGANGGTLNKCTLTENWSGQDGGGASYCTLNDCLLANNSTLRNGGGAYQCILNNCLLQNNSCTAYYYLNLIWGAGGGAALCTLINCRLINNSAANGAGASSSTLINCTVAGNLALSDPYGKGGGRGGGASGSTLKNSILYFNHANVDGANYYGSSLNYCCTIPMPSGISGNISNAPLFVDYTGSNLQLQSNSPCINSGNNSYVVGNLDLSGNARIAGGTVDIGAYEFPAPDSILSYAWAQQFGLPTDGTADFVDGDGDGSNTYAEWIAGTTPTNSASVLALSPPTNNAPGLKVSWQSVTNKTYFLQRATNLLALSAFTSIKSNLAGFSGTTIYADTTATNSGPYFYRVGVQ